MSIPTPTSPGWVERLLESSLRLTAHHFVPGFWRDAGRLLGHIDTVVREMQQVAVPAAIRTYSVYAQRFDLPWSIQRNKLPPESTLEEWLPKVLGEEKYCVSMNGLSKWNEQLQQILCEFLLLPLIEHIGSPLRGADFYTFLGNYDVTPFGIHNDDDHTFVLHLGPADKHVLVWPKQEYLDLVGVDRASFDIDAIRHTAAQYTLRPGDFLFIPEGDFHAFENDSFSATLGMSLFPATNRSVLSDAFALALEDVEPGSNFYGMPDDFTAHQLVKPVGEVLSAVAPTLAKAVDRNRMRLESNGFITTLPRVRSFAGDLEGCTLQWVSPFRVFVVPTDTGMELFIRGRSVRLKRNTHLSIVVDGICSDEGISVAAANALLGSEWTQEATGQFMRLLLELGGAQLCTTRSS